MKEVGFFHLLDVDEPEAQKGLICSRSQSQSVCEVGFTLRATEGWLSHAAKTALPGGGREAPRVKSNMRGREIHAGHKGSLLKPQT